MSRTVISDTEQHALDHRQRVGVEQVALERPAQQLHQLLAVLGLAGEEGGEPLEQRRLRAGLVVVAVHRSGPGVRVCVAQAAQDLRFARLHRRGVGVT